MNFMIQGNGAIRVSYQFIKHFVKGEHMKV